MISVVAQTLLHVSALLCVSVCVCVVYTCVVCVLLCVSVCVRGVYMCGVCVYGMCTRV